MCIALWEALYQRAVAYLNVGFGESENQTGISGQYHANLLRNGGGGGPGSTILALAKNWLGLHGWRGR